MNILLIDDQSSITDGIKLQLELKLGKAQNLTIDTANDFFRACAFLRDSKKKYDLIITDLQMPSKGAGRIPKDASTVVIGWHFIDIYILQEDGEFYGCCKETKIIIFSAFQKELHEYIKENNITMDKRISCIEKGSARDEYGGLRQLIRAIENF